MFAMLSGRWPRTTADGTAIGSLESAVVPGDAAARARLEAALDALVADAVRAQEEAGLDLITDGQVRTADPGATMLQAVATGDLGADGPITRAWRATAALTERMVAQVIPGPYSLARRSADGEAPEVRAERTLQLAHGLALQLGSLQAAGCLMVQVEEPAATSIGQDDVERELFAAAQTALLATAPDLHAMLVIQGGSAWDAGADAILTAPYHSYLFDLIAGPDNWYLVRKTPGDRGIVCGALEIPPRGDPAPTLDWAARYAASANGRGPSRVGLANASSLEPFTPAAAQAALQILAQAARVAELAPADAVAEGLDPRTFPTGHGRSRRGRSSRGRDQASSP
jgi:methionine synthase II (cobalamin-independent)